MYPLEIKWNELMDKSLDFISQFLKKKIQAHFIFIANQMKTEDYE